MLYEQWKNGHMLMKLYWAIRITSSGNKQLKLPSKYRRYYGLGKKWKKDQNGTISIFREPTFTYREFELRKEEGNLKKF